MKHTAGNIIGVQLGCTTSFMTIAGCPLRASWCTCLPFTMGKNTLKSVRLGTANKQWLHGIFPWVSSASLDFGDAYLLLSTISGLTALRQLSATILKILWAKVLLVFGCFCSFWAKFRKYFLAPGVLCFVLTVYFCCCSNAVGVLLTRHYLLFIWTWLSRIPTHSLSSATTSHECIHRLSQLNDPITINATIFHTDILFAVNFLIPSSLWFTRNHWSYYTGTIMPLSSFVLGIPWSHILQLESSTPLSTMEFIPSCTFITFWCASRWNQSGSAPSGSQ